MRIFILSISLLFGTFSVFSQDAERRAYEIERNNVYSKQLENFLRVYLVDKYEERANELWDRDYSSIGAFSRSVESNRRRWETTVVKPPDLRASGPLTRNAYTIEGVKGEWLELSLGSISAEAFLAFPEGVDENIPVPLIIVQHGIGSTPETNFRYGAYHALAKELLKEGFAVLVPINLRTIEHRNRIERLCRLADMSLVGIELVRMQSLLDLVIEDQRIDSDRIGMWGVSLGGLAIMFWMPLEPRIKVGVNSAWFNHRRNKMVIPDDRYTCFLETTEEHAFFAGWLTEFTDSDVVSLICPRPLQFQHGKKDRIAHWPQVVEEFEIARTHYELLNIDEKIELIIHEGGHEAIVDSGVAFLKKWLTSE